LQGQRQYQAGLTSRAARKGRSARAISATRAVMILVSRSSFFAQARPLQARQNLVAEEWKLVEIIDKRYRDPRQPRLAEIDELARNVVGVSHDGQSAHALRVSGADLLKLLGRRVLRRDVLERENIIDRPPVGVLDDGIMVIVLGLLLRPPARVDARNGVDAELRALLLRLAFGGRDLLRGLIE